MREQKLFITAIKMRLNNTKLLQSAYTHRRRRWGGRGGTGPPGWCKVSKFRAKFWAISYSLGNFASKFWAMSCRLGKVALERIPNAGQKNLLKDHRSPQSGQKKRPI